MALTLLLSKSKRDHMTEQQLNFEKYADRRKFTDAAHKRWMPAVYNLFNWTEIVKDENDYETFINDVKHGQDYYVKTPNGKTLSIQERNRTGEKALRFNDVTIRYSYPKYAESLQASEWFKIDADILIYTVVGKQPKVLSDLAQYDSYDKIVVVDMRKFERYVKTNHIQIVDNLRTQTSMFASNSTDKILLSPLRHNVEHRDDSPSDFIVFDVKHLYELDPSLIGFDKGFGTPKDILLSQK